MAAVEKSLKAWLINNIVREGDWLETTVEELGRVTVVCSGPHIGKWANRQTGKQANGTVLTVLYFTAEPDKTRRGPGWIGEGWEWKVSSSHQHAAELRTVPTYLITAQSPSNAASSLQHTPATFRIRLQPLGVKLPSLGRAWLVNISAICHIEGRQTDRVQIVPELAKEGVGKAAQPAAKQGFVGAARVHLLAGGHDSQPISAGRGAGETWQDARSGLHQNEA
ncbi:hypothetical protein CIB48_g11454 [Xylaria polymorpha]|nr:hypothetical protein CIB48_g11454 [Xylaria polymorpha]